MSESPSTVATACCSTAPAEKTTDVAANPCCGTAQAAEACCDPAAKTEAVTGGAGCC